MSEPWHEGLPDEAFKTEADVAYEKAFATIKEGLAAGLEFDAACNAIDVKDEALKAVIIDDFIKVAIAEEHFAKRVPLEDIAERLRIPVGRLEAAKASMIEEVQRASLKAFRDSREEGS